MLLRHRLACLAPAHVCFVLVLVERRWSRAGGGTNAPGADIASALGPITSGIRAHKAAAALHVVGICPSVYQLVLVSAAANKQQTLLCQCRLSSGDSPDFTSLRGEPASLLCSGIISAQGSARRHDADMRHRLAGEGGGRMPMHWPAPLFAGTVLVSMPARDNRRRLHLSSHQPC